MLYFAYGSNLSLERIHRNCMDAVKIERVDLPNYRLAFVGKSRRWKRRGVATIIPEEGSLVHGALYEISEADAEALDIQEGVPVSYRREFITVNGRRALTYISNSPNANAPCLEYLNVIRQGYRDWELPVELLDNIKTID